MAAGAAVGVDYEQMARLATDAELLSPDARRLLAFALLKQWMPDEDHLILALTANQQLPPGERKTVATVAAQALPLEDQRDVRRALGGPTQLVVDRLWMWIVAALVVVLIGTSIAVGVFVYQGKEGSAIVLSMFTAVLGYLAGLVSSHLTSRD